MAISNSNDLFQGTDQRGRCWWCAGHDDYVHYHDSEWGVPTKQDHLLFEKICLEGFQSGLSWLTILRKRPRFREVFDGFDFNRVASFDDKRVEKLACDPGIIRHRGKIRSVINNAGRALEMVQKEGSLAAFFWRFEPKNVPPIRSREDLVATTAESIAMAQELKKRNWSFVGPTTCYAFMQSMGIVNDHHRDCFRWPVVQSLRQRFSVPT
ncbi:MAG: DNA-3-methyladenine glycosylase I [Planctomycetota bacterium]